MKKHQLLPRIITAASVIILSATAMPVRADEQNAVGATLAQQARTRLEAARTPQDYEEVAILYKSAIKAEPDNYEMRVTVGWIYIEKLHRPDDAYPYLSDVVRHNPNDLNARKLLGMACMQTGRNGRAVEQFKAASQLQPNDLWIKAELGRSYARLGAYGRANEIFEDILKTDPNNSEARLGEAEIAAWQGHTETALDTLRTLQSENPTNAEVLTLIGDIHRWKWKLTEAKQDYQQALDIDPNDSQAKKGLKETKLVEESELGGKAYYFQDTTHFLRESAGGNGRIHLTDKAYLLGSGTYWRYNSPNVGNVDRVDGQAGLEYHWNRWLETSAEGDMYAYIRQQQHPIWGGEGSVKLSPFNNLDIYTTLIGRQPFVSSISTVTNHLKQNAVGNGVDFRIFGPLSIQNELEVARITDGNKWWEDKPQVSLHVLHWPDTFIRVQYDHLSYSHTNATYWTPRNRNVLSPILDVNLPLFKGLSLDFDGRAPYVFDVSQWGYQFEGGPVLNINNHVELKASYYISYIPGDQGAWSGKGGQASITVRF